MEVKIKRGFIEALLYKLGYIKIAGTRIRVASTQTSLSDIELKGYVADEINSQLRHRILKGLHNEGSLCYDRAHVDGQNQFSCYLEIDLDSL